VKKWGSLVYRVPGKPGKVQEFQNGYFQAWKSPEWFEKVMENY